MNGHHESKIPFEEMHQFSFCLHNVGVWWILWTVQCGLRVVFLYIINEYKLIVNLIVFWGYQEACGQKDCKNPLVHRLDISVLLRSLIKKESIHKFNCDMQCFYSLLEFFPHLEYAINETGSLLSVLFCNLVLLKIQISAVNIMIKFVLGLVLEHLCEELSRRYVSIKFLIFWFYCWALILNNKNGY